MIKSIIITHGNLGHELIQVAEKILEQKLDIEAIAFDWQGDGSDMIAQLEKFIASNKGHKIIIFTDMFGGSPSNIATRFINKNVEVLSGINLPGLLKFFCYEEKCINFMATIKIVEQGAIEGINIISEYLGDKK
jgi:mannose/fructose-specific phosphotransferase system component IIA